MKRTNLLILVSFLSGFVAFSQQESQYANSAYNAYYLNPAAGGLTNTMQFEVTGRTQWAGYNGGPRTMLFMGHSQINTKKNENALGEFNVKDEPFFSSPKVSTGSIKHIVGGKASVDAIGPFAKTSIHGSYAIHLPFVKSFNFGVGVGLGMSNFKVNEDRVTLYQQDDIAYEQFLGSTSTQNILDVNAGLVFYNEDLFFGLSTSQVLNNKVQFDGVTTGSNFARHYFLVTRYKIDIDDHSIEPSVVGKFTGNAPMSFDIGARFNFNGSSWLGFQYRTSNALVFQVGSNIVKNLYLGYNYEHTIGPVQTTSNGTHEVQLGLYIGNNRNIDKEIKDNKKINESEQPEEEATESK